MRARSWRGSAACDMLPITMVTKNDIAAVMRHLGKRKSKRKAEAARASGKLGGRPRKCRVCGAKMRRLVNKWGKLAYSCSKCKKDYFFKSMILGEFGTLNPTDWFL